jgi:acetaldehyde dehydrogenase (acetylating)
MVNSPSAQGGVGGCNNLLISYTLGCGTIGGSAVSENVGPQNFINKKVIAWGTVDLSDLKAIDPTWDYDPEPAAPAADTFANAFNSAASSGITQDQLNEIVNLMVKSLKGEK